MDIASINTGHCVQYSCRLRLVVRDSRAAIIGATVDLLRDGDGAFTYEHLAERAGVARQTLYSHFPDRAELLVTAVEQIRGELDLEELTAKVYLAATARAALEALLELHIAFTPPLLVGLRAVEAQRAAHPEVSRAFERRSAGRRQLVLHVVTRLQAEGDLAPEWSVADAADLLSALLAGGFTAELLEEREWTTGKLHDRLHHLIDHALLTARSKSVSTGQRSTTNTQTRGKLT